MEQKIKPIFCIGAPFIGEDFRRIYEEPKIKELEKEYHVLIFTAIEVSFELFNSDDLEPTDLIEIKKYITEKCR